ncbi:MAG: hypothetical protein ABIJ08_00995 [Nanoarchaeota archaeon]
MTGVLSGGGTSTWEPFSLGIGFISIISSLFFFLYRFEVITLTIEIPDEFFLFYFPSLILISGTMHLLSTIGIFGMK